MKGKFGWGDYLNISVSTINLIVWLMSAIASALSYDGFMIIFLKFFIAFLSAFFIFLFWYHAKLRVDKEVRIDKLEKNLLAEKKITKELKKKLSEFSEKSNGGKN